MGVSTSAPAVPTVTCTPSTSSEENSGADIYRTNNFNYPLQRDRYGNYKIKSGELIRVCMTSDFFLEEADQWRADVIFYLLTKRPERVANCLPDDFGNGWENIWFNVTCENQQMANKLLPYLKELPLSARSVFSLFLRRVLSSRSSAVGKTMRVPVPVITIGY